MPGAVGFKHVNVRPGADPARRTVEIRWEPSRDEDGDLLGYRVYVATHARGWNYPRFAGSKEARAFWSSEQGWEPEMYDALHTLPPSDVDLMKTAEPHVTLELVPGQDHFITVLPFDEYGESIGKRFYLMSNELAIERVGDEPGADISSP